MKTVKNRVGRPSKYDPKMNEQVYKLCLLGAKDKEIADFFGIAEQTLNLWKTAEPEFMESLKKGKIEADVKAAESLYKRALGYQFKEVKEEQIEIEVGEKKVPAIKRTVTYKEVCPDVTAQIFWLKNRQPDKWRDVKEHKVDGEIRVSTELKEARDRVTSRLTKYSNN